MTPEEKIEQEANYFAMCLLMPAELVVREVNKLGGIDIENGEQMKMLARRFRVSETIMAVRLGQVMGPGTVAAEGSRRKLRRQAHIEK